MLKGQFHEIFYPFFKKKKIYLGPVCMNRQRQFREIFCLCEDICETPVLGSR